MSDEIRKVLRESVTVHPRTLQGDELWKRGRQRRVRRGLTIACASVAVVAAGWSLGGTLVTSTQTPEPVAPGGQESAADWLTYTDENHGYTASYPPDWERAEENLTPNLKDPQEILSLGTLPLGGGESECTQFAGQTLESMNSDDVFLTIQEVDGRLSGPLVDRGSEPLRLDDGYETEAKDCVGGPTYFDDRLIPFRDGQRFFFAYLAIGRSASDQTLEEAQEILNRLRFEDTT